MPPILQRTAVSRTLRGLSLGLLAAALLPAVVLADQFAGSFQGDGLWLELEAEAAGVYMGVIALGEQIFLCEARRGGPGLVGNFETDGQSFAFEMQAIDHRTLRLKSGGKSYDLVRVGADAGNPPTGGGAPNPLADGAEGGEPSSPEVTTLAGHYQGSLQGIATVAVLAQNGSQLGGRLEVGGYPYELEGTVVGALASGRGRDPQTGGGFGFEASLSGNVLELVVVVQDPPSGQQQRQRGSLRRTGASAVPEAGGSGGTRGVPSGPRDPSLVGLWRQSESMSGGGSSLVVETFLQINPDGTWAMGGGRAVGGGGGWGGDTGSGGVQETGYWKSENQIVYIQSPGSGQWQPFARYYLEGGTLMFTFGDGSRQILHRVR